jgi:hypothetical protein
MLATRAPMKTLLAFILAPLCAGLFAPAAVEANADTSAPFSDLAGTWAGDGSIVLTKGTTERMRCDATYVVSGGGETADLTLRCASDSYHFDLRIGLADTAGAILGTWREPTQNVEGGISGMASRSLIQLTARGQDFTAAVRVSTRGNTQTVQIRAKSGDLSRVAITLHHGH